VAQCDDVVDGSLMVGTVRTGEWKHTPGIDLANNYRVALAGPNH
jgi:hypothetical protein